MDRYNERSMAPYADLILEMVALNQQIAAMERETIEMSIRSLELQTRVNRTLGRISDATQQMELRAGKKKATSGLADAA